MKVEWEYLAVLAVSLAASFYGLLKGAVSIEHATLILLGVTVTASVFLVEPLVEEPVKIGRLNLSNFLLQTALLNVALGVSALKPVEVMFKPLPYVVLIGITTEESFRIGVFHLVHAGLKSKFAATLTSGVVFALIHVHWHPTQWVFAVAGGMLFSVMLMLFQSQTACVASHFLYDMLCFSHVAPAVYFAFSFFALAVGILTRHMKLEV